VEGPAGADLARYRAVLVALGGSQRHPGSGDPRGKHAGPQGAGLAAAGAALGGAGGTADELEGGAVPVARHLLYLRPSIRKGLRRLGLRRGQYPRPLAGIREGRTRREQAPARMPQGEPGVLDPAARRTGYACGRGDRDRRPLEAAPAYPRAVRFERQLILAAY